MLRSLCTLVTGCKSIGLPYTPCRTVCMHCSSTTSLTHHRMESKAILYTNGVCYNLKYIIIGHTNLWVHSCMRHANHIAKNKCSAQQTLLSSFDSLHYFGWKILLPAGQRADPKWRKLPNPQSLLFSLTWFPPKSLHSWYWWPIRCSSLHCLPDEQWDVILLFVLLCRLISFLCVVYCRQRRNSCHGNSNY